MAVIKKFGYHLKQTTSQVSEKSRQKPQACTLSFSPVPTEIKGADVTISKIIGCLDTI
jgi:hypothetical protein